MLFDMLLTFNLTFAPKLSSSSKLLFIKQNVMCLMFHPLFPPLGFQTIVTVVSHTGWGLLHNLVKSLILKPSRRKSIKDESCDVQCWLRLKKGHVECIINLSQACGRLHFGYYSSRKSFSFYLNVSSPSAKWITLHEYNLRSLHVYSIVRKEVCLII